MRPGVGGGIALYTKYLAEALGRYFFDIELHLIETFFNHNHYCNIDDSRCTRHLLTMPSRYHDQTIDVINKVRPEVVFYPIAGEPIIKLEKTKFVVCIADLQHKTYHQYFSSGDILARDIAFSEAAALADKIVTLSEHAKSEIVSTYGLNSSDVIVVNPALADNFGQTKKKLEEKYLRDRYGLSSEYLFYPANFWRHKNHANLFRAMSLLKESGLKTQLVLTGALFNERKDLADMLHELGIEEMVKVLGYVAQEDLEALIRNAKMMVFPSLFEGFGIPLLEAFKSGVPVCCSDKTSLPEVAGDDALFFDAENPESISQTIKKLMTDQKLSDDLVKRGKSRARKFSYKSSATTLYELFKSLSVKEKVAPEDSGPLVSIITPSFNQGCFIEDTIKSVLNQTYKNIEYIVVDGQSTDETLAILDKYSDRLRYFSERDDGQADAINKGIRKSNGQFLCYLNSDDTLEPTAVSHLVSYLLANPHVDVVYGDANYIDKNNKIIEPYYTCEWDFERFKGHCFICQPATMWKRTVIEIYGDFDKSLKYIMDYEYWLRIAHHGGTIRYLPMTLANSRLYKETKTKSGREYIFKEIFCVTKKIFGKTSIHWTLQYAHYILEEKYKFVQLLFDRKYFQFLKKHALIFILLIYAPSETMQKINHYFKVNFYYKFASKIYSILPAKLTSLFLQKSNIALKEVCGVYGDGWVSPNLQVRYKRKKPLKRLILEGESLSAQTMKIILDGREVIKHFGKGFFKVSVDIDSPTTSTVMVSCSTYKKEVGRKISYLLHYTNLFTDIEVEWDKSA